MRVYHALTAISNECLQVLVHDFTSINGNLTHFDQANRTDTAQASDLK